MTRELEHSIRPSCLTDELRLAQAVKDAIADGLHPKMISKGSSGSYFARAKVEGKVQTVAYVIPVVSELCSA